MFHITGRHHSTKPVRVLVSSLRGAFSLSLPDEGKTHINATTTRSHEKGEGTKRGHEKRKTKRKTSKEGKGERKGGGSEYETESDMKEQDSNRQKQAVLRSQRLPLRPRSSYIFFYKETRDLVVSQNPDLPCMEIAKRVALKWRSLSAEAREKYKKLHQKDVKRYERDAREYHKKVLGQLVVVRQGKRKNSARGKAWG